MKRLAVATLAASLLAVPTISQAAPVINAPISQSGVVQVDWKPAKKKVVVKRKPNGTVTRKVVRKHGDHRVVTVKKWRNGNKYSSWRSHRPIHDYHRHGLRRPGRGQEWIRVGNDYLLVSILSGIIAGAVAASH
ncbi:MAG TPA: RcnB family protein [Rhizobiaceae bacterium]|nr:RcnB family protein [Rhizobiaceae bacterium]